MSKLIYIIVFKVNDDGIWIRKSVWHSIYNQYSTTRLVQHYQRQGYH